jgi:hypothetical protein
MNTPKIVTIAILLGGFLAFSACSKEEIPQPNACFTSDKTDANVGEPVTFTSCSEGLAFSIWTGDSYHSYANYGYDAGVQLSDDFISYEYPEPGTFTVVLVATSYGNDGTEVYEDVDSLSVTITDGRAELTEFGFRSPKVVGTITGRSISVEVPFGTNLASLKPTFRRSSSFAVVSSGGVELVSGKTAVNFTNPAEIIVTAQTGDTARYIANVFSNPDTGKEITAFSINEIPGVFDGNSITVTLPAGNSDFTGLKADFETSSDKAVVTVNGTVQTSGSSRNDFSSPLTYTVTAEDESSTDYLVTVKEEIGFISYGFEQLVPPVYATMSGYDLTVQVLEGTPVDSMYATFVTTDHNPTVKIGDIVQESGVTLNDFSGPVTYTLEAENQSVDYTVRITVIK